MNTLREKYKSDLVLFSLILIISGFGLNILLASSSFLARQSFGDPYYFVKRQALFMLLGIIIMIAISQINFKLWEKLAWPFYILTLILLLLVFVPGLGKKAGGASRWIALGSLSIQPSDLAKFSILLLLSRLYSKEEKVSLSRILITFILLGLPVLLIVLEPDLGTSLHLLMAAIVLLFLASFPFRLMLVAFIISIPVIFYGIVKVPYRWDRVKSFLDPIKYRFEGAYQLVASFKAFESGGISGRGLGEGISRHNLQARHTDFILSVVAEDLGFLGISFLFLLFFSLTIYAFFMIRKHETKFGKLLAISIISLFICQVIINASVSMGLTPTTGINLPLISYGGTSIVTYMFMFGILLNISKERSRI